MPSCCIQHHRKTHDGRRCNETTAARVRGDRHRGADHVDVSRNFLAVLKVTRSSRGLWRRGVGNLAHFEHNIALFNMHNTGVGEL